MNRVVHSLSARILAGLLVLSAAGSTASAGQLLGAAGNYNVYVLNNFTQQNTDSLGAIAVGGKFDPGGTITTSVLNGSGSYSVGSSLNSGNVGLAVGGSYRNGSTTVNGSMYVGGNATIAGTTNGALTVAGNLTRNSGQFTGNQVIGGNAVYNTPSGTGNITTNGSLTLNSGGYVTGNISHYGALVNNNGYNPYSGTNTTLGSAATVPSSPVDFAATSALLLNQSAALGNLANTGTVILPTSQNNFMTITGTSATYDVVTISAADLTNLSGRGLNINGVAGSTLVINVAGTVASMSNFAMNLSGIDRQHVLFNFKDATSLTINSISVQGTVLAAQADVNFAGGNIDGTMIAKNLSGQGESHLYLFQGNVPLSSTVSPTAVALPEPGTLAMASVALAFGGLAVRRRKARATA